MQNYTKEKSLGLTIFNQLLKTLFKPLHSKVPNLIMDELKIPVRQNVRS